MFGAFKHIKIKTLSLWIGGLMLTVAVAPVSMSMVTVYEVGSAGANWKAYSAGAASKTAVLSDLRDALGYGGMIHELKNFLLRRDRPRIIKIHRKLRDAEVALTTYRSLGVNPREQAAIANLDSVLDEYLVAVGVAEEMAAKGATPRAIDEAVRITDAPGIDALAVLDRELLAIRRAGVRDVDESLTDVKVHVLAVAVTTGCCSARRSSVCSGSPGIGCWGR